MSIYGLFIYNVVNKLQLIKIKVCFTSYNVVIQCFKAETKPATLSSMYIPNIGCLPGRFVHGQQLLLIENI